MAMYWSNDREDAEETPSTGSSTPATPSTDRLYAPISGNAWPSIQSETTKEVLQSVLRVRKSWKTLRGGETVWPLDLEAALLEGLENYQPDDSRETRMLGRFPRRNRFISDYIFQKTGQRRSAKQVGSRLQQLRESCGGKKLLRLLSTFRQPVYAGSSASSDSSCNSPVSPSMAGQASYVRHIVIYIDILPEGAPDAVCEPSPPVCLESGDVVHASERPRHLGSINPTVTLVAPSSLVAHSRFSVYSEERMMHAETAPLVLVEDAPVSGFLYSTLLVPAYWKVISESEDPTQFTIYQEVCRDANSAILFSATYKFSYPGQNLSTSTFDTLGPSNTRPALDLLLSAASMEHSQFQSGRHPVYVAPEWSPTLPYSRENSPNHGYHSPSSDSSIRFPSDLSNYVL
ncbi:hypothetical protein C8R47DRAFT_104122 [Mycena vitilis]|nr:hypothetical protein C8R47DRAFT_104122 [Mycena vitilis]